MISDMALQTIRSFAMEENVRLGEPMNRHTTFRVGGLADCFVEVCDKEALQKLCKYLKAAGIPFFLMGNGSNLLVSDQGYRGVILRVQNGMNEVKVLGTRIRAQAGATMAQVSKVAMEHGLSGLEFASGIPGTIGGGVVMNAGAYDGDMSQVIKSVEVLSPDGEFWTLDNATMEFGYRTSAVKGHGYVVTEAEFELTPGDPAQIKAVMDGLAAKRREKQPLEFPSAGSTFKRPEGHFAGKLIQDAGLRGYAIGGAQVSEKHCGFVINTLPGETTAADVYALIKYVQAVVKEQFDVKLEPEVIFLGDFD